MRMHDLSRFHFTVHNDLQIDAVISGQLREIAEELLALLGGRLTAVLVAGGFGRGEGGIVRNGDSIRPINDYDLYLVVKNLRKTRREFGERIEGIAQRLSLQFGIKQIDMGLVSRWQLWIPRNSVTRYEAKEGHQIVYGPPKMCIRSIKAAHIPLKEGTQYFSTRGGGLLIARYILENRERLDNMPWFENFSIEMNKAGIALGDAELIERGEYHWSYRERLKRFKALPREAGMKDDGQAIRPVYEAAVGQKLDPRFQPDPEHDLEKEWMAMTDLFIGRFLVFEGNRFRQPFTDLEEYEAFIGRSSFNLGGRLYSRLYRMYSGAKSSRSPDQNRLLVFLLLDGVKNAGTLQRAERLLGMPKGDPSANRERWLAAVGSLLKQWHPEGIVAKLLVD